MNYNSPTPILIVGIIAVIALAGMIYNYQNDRDDPVTHIHESFKSDKALVDWFNENFMSEGEAQIQLKEIQATHKQIMDDHEALVDTTEKLLTDVLILQAQKDITTQPTSPTPKIDTINLNLRVSDSNGQIQSQYSRDIQALVINGDSTYFDRSYLITIKGPDGDFVKDKFSKTTSKGKIAEAWLPINAQPGDYLVTITIDQRTDSITFKLV